MAERSFTSFWHSGQVSLLGREEAPPKVTEQQHGSLENAKSSLAMNGFCSVQTVRSLQGMLAEAHDEATAERRERGALAGLVLCQPLCALSQGEEAPAPEPVNRCVKRAIQPRLWNAVPEQGKSDSLGEEGGFS